ncbi:ATP-dependent zinc metalloprotease YME1 homolog isoform X1 [Scaptodrosophila lebanonensis]|uniref:ATP-dependent zinc metalloprotease YME1 homolog isoform X1 n=1 Tax=Drosophila lebanonensis TaxID=7225 RepID=A0A6J2UBQ6_DROLE|nr:ATP-dependent zinc metalloprotease YME1 homolog isoform X1 [Scaptodrosophila lebanonensis]
MFSANTHSVPFYLGNFSRKPHYYTVKKTKLQTNGSAARALSERCKSLTGSPQHDIVLDFKNLLSRSGFSLQQLVEKAARLNGIFEKELVSDALAKVTSMLPAMRDVRVTLEEPATQFGQNYQFEVSLSGEALAAHPTGAFVKMYPTITKGLLSPLLLSNRQLKQWRGFKTDRSIEAEQKRNPTMTTRLKSALGGSPLKPDGETQLQAEKLRKLLSKTGEHGDPKNMPLQESLKIAFAEGYLAASNADDSPKTGKTMKYLKIFQTLIVIVVFIGIFLSFFTSSNGSVFRIQLGNQVEVDPEEIHVTFDDVKGCDEAKQELKEVVEFLKNPDKFSNLGGKLPKGVLLVGPPGTGKTLLARAVAGEANVPFFHAAGPEFDEVLVGQGARRVRDLFKAAKARAPCVIFIDEIDSVGAKRTNSVLHPYANQTINQLLSEMDGFHQNAGVIVLGATNRRDDLDQALLRPGRFDVEVMVSTPDFTGRKEILSLYLTKVLHDDVDLDMLARGTSGFTGADLENMINQAALRAAIDGAETVTMKHLETARDKVLMGPERKARLPDEEANTITAYHEGGHAIVAYYTKESHPLHKVTIMPRGPSLGHTAYIPEKERYHVTKAQLLAMMDTMMGGRAAEEIIFGADKITSGASSDLKQATSIATHMVKDWGMSDKVGLRTIETPKGLMAAESLGPNTVEAVDAEIKRILSESYDRAKTILKKHTKEHKALAEALLKYETLDADDIKAILSDNQT